jgi:hypothetical protein
VVRASNGLRRRSLPTFLRFFYRQIVIIERMSIKLREAPMKRHADIFCNIKEGEILSALLTRYEALEEFAAIGGMIGSGPCDPLQVWHAVIACPQY